MTKPNGVPKIFETAEGRRLVEARTDPAWRRWGPYLSDRQWGTVREDYSAGGDAWDYLPHDHARSRAYRWGEDGIGGFGDGDLNWCLALALWNGRDPILKERLFGLTNAEGNHGEDVKELYYYSDGVPTHAFMRMLYKYPQSAFPYQRLLDENRSRGLDDPEFELLDTGLFDEGRYFRRRHRLRQGRPGRRADARHRDQPRARSRRPHAAAAALGAQSLVVARWRDQAEPRDPARRLGRGHPPRHAGSPLPRRRRGRDSVHRQRDQPAPAVRRRPGRGLLQGRHRPLRGAGRDRCRQHRRGHQMRRPLRSPPRPRREPHPAPAPAPGRIRNRGVRRFRRGVFDAPRRGRRVLRSAAGPDRRPRDAPRPAPGARRHALVEAALPLRRAGMARRRSESAGAAARAQARAQQRLEPPARPRHHLDAGRLGIPLVRLLGPSRSRRSSSR